MAPNSSSCPLFLTTRWWDLAQPLGLLMSFAALRGLTIGATVPLLLRMPSANTENSLPAEEAAAECVSEDALVHLKSYQYSAVDKSPVSYYILRPYWNWAAGLLPVWMAPNMVTLVGFFFILANVGLLALFVPDLIGPGPSWLYFSFALGLFMYQTMDNIDGKQARRTGTSSGLGELFDHGIDSLNCTLASLLETAAMGLGTSKTGVFTALCPCIPMFFSTWETYHSHTLYLGFINGPTEGLLIAASIMALSGVYGPQIWTTPVVKVLGEDYTFGYAEQLGDLAVRDVWALTIIGGLFVHVPGCIKHVIEARRRQKLPIAPVFLEWTPMAVYTFSIGFWLYSPFSTLRRENHLVLFCLTMSFVFGRMTTKMILAHLTRQPFPYWTVMLFPLVGGAILGNLPRFGLPAVTAEVETAYLYGYFVFAMIAYFRWAFLVTGSICNYLGIRALTVPPEKIAETRRREQAVKGDKATNGHVVNGKKAQ